MESTRDLWTLAVTEEELHQICVRVLREHGYAVSSTYGYIYAPGSLPLLLLAHMDVVGGRPPRFRRKGAFVYGPGADDRAGVAAILTLIREGYRPHVMFTHGEESGGLGALQAIRELQRPEVHAIIALDRRGCGQAVYYDCGSRALREYIEKFGFTEEQGTFSDCSILGSHWDIAAVNLSIGFHNEHTHDEYLDLVEFLDTMNKMRAILSNPPESPMKYEAVGQTGGIGQQPRGFEA